MWHQVLLGRLRRDLGAKAPAVLVALPAAAFGGCSGIQSALDPKGRDAALVADLWWGMLAVGSVVMAGVLVLLAIALLRSGRAADRPPSERTGWLVVIGGGIVLPVAAVIAMVVVSSLIGREVAARRGEPAADIEIVGRLWWWEVNYRDGEGNVIATTANEIHIPVGQPVRLALASDNVIHSFWVPNLQGKTDMIPGQVNESWVEAGEAGIFRGQCAEFCGVQHTLMAFLVVAQPPDAFEAWLARQAEPAAEPSTPAEASGREVFLSTSCPACHTIRGTPAAGTSGPDLTHLASRRTLAAGTMPNTRGHLGGWISNPQNLKPGALMPATALAPDRLQALLSYLQSLE